MKRKKTSELDSQTPVRPHQTMLEVFQPGPSNKIVIWSYPVLYLMTLMNVWGWKKIKENGVYQNRPLSVLTRIIIWSYMVLSMKENGVRGWKKMKENGVYQNFPLSVPTRIVKWSYPVLYERKWHVSKLSIKCSNQDRHMIISGLGWWGWRVSKIVHFM